MKSSGAVSLFIILLFFIFLADALMVEPSSLKVTDTTFDMLHGNGSLRIVFIADIHAGLQKPGYLSEAVGKVNTQSPDIVLIGGDMIEADGSELDMLGPLKDLKPRLGSFAVLGNHDYGWSACPAYMALSDKVEKKLESENITVLRNERVVFDLNGSEIALIGVDDVLSCRNEYVKASAGLDDGIPKIILIHNQAGIDPRQVRGPSLILSGHTHCGQVRVPLITELFMGTRNGKTLGGRERLDFDTEAYVTCGITGGGIRFGSNPEISVIDIG